jgi:hypothetical protein
MTGGAMAKSAPSHRVRINTGFALMVAARPFGTERLRTASAQSSQFADRKQ